MIVTIATAWNASAGGINAFNIEFTRALARVSADPVICAVIAPSPDEVLSAARDNVTLVTISAGEDGKPEADCGSEIVQAVADGLGTDVRLWIGHDLVSGEVAVAAAATYGGRLALIHHMDYLSYQNFAGDRSDQTVKNQRRQIRLFKTPGATLFGVGSWLSDNVARLGGKDGFTIIPGFPSHAGGAHRSTTDRLLVLAAGRFSNGTEPIKRMATALDGMAAAVRDGRDLQALRRPTLTILGVTPGKDQTDLQRRASEIAGRPINVVAAGFDEDPTAVAELASISHLVIVPSRHEGFGLVGWEAIGTETPLIVGRGTGLAHQLRSALDGEEEGLVSILDLDGSDRDAMLISEAIRKVAGDLPGALRRARTLRSRLIAELSCQWGQAAASLLAEVGMPVDEISPRAQGMLPSPIRFADEQTNHFERCVELGAAAAQGSSRQSVEVVAELRFGVTEIQVDDIEAELSLSGATLEVKPRTGRLKKEDRLGEGSRAVPGIKAQAGGVWQMKPTEGEHLLGKVMGYESICVVESTAEQPVVIDFEVTTSRRHIRCALRAKRKLNKNAEKVIGVFLKNCIYKPVSGHVVLSSAVVREDGR